MFLVGTYCYCSTMYMNIEVWPGYVRCYALSVSRPAVYEYEYSSYAGTKHKAEPVTVNG